MKRTILVGCLACSMFLLAARASSQSATVHVPDVTDVPHAFGHLTLAGSTQHATDRQARWAFRLSLFGTTVPTVLGGLILLGGGDGGLGGGLVGGGVILGPSLGYLYTGRVGRGLSGVGTRIGVTALTALTTTIPLVVTRGAESGVAVGVAAMGVGLAIIVISAVQDIISVDDEVRKAHKSRQKSRLTVWPSYDPRGRTASLGLVLAF